MASSKVSYFGQRSIRTSRYCQCQFKRELKPFEKYKISSRILAWDRKWLFVISKFVTAENKVNAIAITKYVFKVGRLTIAPEEYLRHCNF